MGIAVNLVTYLNGTMHLPSASSANIVTDFMATSFLLYLFGGLLANTWQILNDCNFFSSSGSDYALDYLRYGFALTARGFGHIIHKGPCGRSSESSRLFARRQVHPFFSQWKVGKSNPENYDLERNCGMTIGKDKHFKFNPIDALEDIKCSFVEHQNYKIVYMRYASLFFFVGVDNDEVPSFLSMLVKFSKRVGRQF
ncbi:hypothetical protein Dimus_010239, partial [Dionaea muscipula]